LSFSKNRHIILAASGGMRHTPTEGYMPVNDLSHPFFLLYRALWRMAYPFLKRSARLSDGWEERIVDPNWLGDEFPPDADGRRIDVWLQAASGGEARLAEAICGRFDPSIPLRLVIATWTPQGRDIASSALEALKRTHPLLRAATRFTPLDNPDCVSRALDEAAPRVVALLETELWPGLMAACRERDIPVIVLNGRLNRSTMRFKNFFPSLCSHIAPQKVLAVSPEDRGRYASMFRCRAETMHNIKFDLSRHSLETPPPPHPLASCFPRPVFLFASVRHGEYRQFPRDFHKILDGEKGTLIIAPRHMQSTVGWFEMVTDLGFRAVRASSLHEGEALAPGTAVVWDRFGDLPQLYALASAAFVGGTISQGGQNFLEPLSAGIEPFIGPSVENFAWALTKEPDGTPSLEAEDLIHMIRNPRDVMDAMLAYAAQPPSRESVRERYRSWLSGHIGGAAAAAREIEGFLHH